MRLSQIFRIIFVPAVALIAGLGTLGASDPNPTRSEYFESAGGGFTYDRKAEVVRLNITLKPLKPVPPSAFLVTTFQNPANPAKPLVVEKLAKDSLTKRGNWLDVQSAPVTGMKDNATYLISVRLYADKTKKTLLSTHDQRVAYHQGMMDYVKRMMPLRKPK